METMQSRTTQPGAYKRITDELIRLAKEIKGQDDWENTLTAYAYDLIAEDEDEPNYGSFEVHAIVNKAINTIA